MATAYAPYVKRKKLSKGTIEKRTGLASDANISRVETTGIPFGHREPWKKMARALAIPLSTNLFK